MEEISLVQYEMKWTNNYIVKTFPEAFTRSLIYLKKKNPSYKCFSEVFSSTLAAPSMAHI